MCPAGGCFHFQARPSGPREGEEFTQGSPAWAREASLHPSKGCSRQNSMIPEAQPGSLAPACHVAHVCHVTPRKKSVNSQVCPASVLRELRRSTAGTQEPRLWLQCAVCPRVVQVASLSLSLPQPRLGVQGQEQELGSRSVAQAGSLGAGRGRGRRGGSAPGRDGSPLRNPRPLGLTRAPAPQCVYSQARLACAAVLKLAFTLSDALRVKPPHRLDRLVPHGCRCFEPAVAAWTDKWSVCKRADLLFPLLPYF